MIPMVCRFFSFKDAVLMIGWVWICLLRVIKDERRHSRTKGFSGLPHPHWDSVHDCACIGMDEDLVAHLFHPNSEPCPATGSRFASVHDLYLISHSIFHFYFYWISEYRVWKPVCKYVNVSSLAIHSRESVHKLSGQCQIICRLSTIESEKEK